MYAPQIIAKQHKRKLLILIEKQRLMVVWGKSRMK
jgi:hypothetical protein